jgi:hypothetical protein
MNLARLLRKIKRQGREEEGMGKPLAILEC